MVLGSTSAAAGADTHYPGHRWDRRAGCAGSSRPAGAARAVRRRAC